MTAPDFDELWEGTPPATEHFDPEALGALPEAAQRYLRHAIAPGTPLANGVKLTMEGEILLHKWQSFRAEQVLRWDRGMIWRAKVKAGPLSVTGYDSVVDGEGSMRWKVLGIVPLVTADGPDVSRSALGRAEAEFIWLPSVLTHDDVRWSATDDVNTVDATVHLSGDEQTLRLHLGPDGELLSLRMKRWGNPEGGAFHAEPFGAIVEAKHTVRGYTVPKSVRVGWHFDGERFAEDGEFFHAHVLEAEYR